MTGDVPFTRRGVLRGVVTGGLAATGGAVFGAKTTSTSSTTIGGLDITGTSVTTFDGTIDAVLLDVSGDWRFDGLDTPAESVGLVLQVSEPGASDWETIDAVVYDTPSGRAGSGQFSFTDADVLSATAWSASDFESPAEGESKTTTVRARVAFEVYPRDGSGGAALVPPAVAETTFDVTVTNSEVVVTFSGSCHTASISGLSFVDGFALTFSLTSRNGDTATDTVTDEDLRAAHGDVTADPTAGTVTYELTPPARGEFVISTVTVVPAGGVSNTHPSGCGTAPPRGGPEP